MAFEHKENSGSLFKNRDKKEDNHPDYSGTVNIDGKLLSISAWLKDGKTGKYMSLSFRPPRDRQPIPDAPAPAQRPKPASVPTPNQDPDDGSDLPF